MDRFALGQQQSPVASAASDIDDFLFEPEKPPVVAAPRRPPTKTQRLTEANQQLEQLLSGGVKLMTDVLALARPELFQKAAKVQRWARRLQKRIEVEKAWELDLASLLYPLGVIALPDELAHKYAADLPMTEEDALRLEESALIASRLIANIPRMDGVARAVFYSRKGYDGSGWPKDGPKGDDLPQTARILKVVIDLADAATGVSRNRAQAFAQVTQNAQRYDPKILRIAYATLVEPANPEAQSRIKVPTALLHSGDVLLHDIVGPDERLLLAAGVELTELSVKRLAVLVKAGQAPDQVTVLRA